MSTAATIAVAVIAALMPTTVALIGIILARQDMRDFRSEIRGDLSAIRTDLNGKFDLLQSDLKEFNKITARLEGRVDEIKDRIK